MSRQAHAPAAPLPAPPARHKEWNPLDSRTVFHRCPGCKRPIPVTVRRCSTRTCPEYAPTWARDTRRRLLENLRIVPLTVMFSVTAPGADLYPFDPRFCSHSPSERCSGRMGCRVDPEVAEAFNRRAGAWWSRLHRAAKVRADRVTGHSGRLLARVWEKQQRGLALVHGVIAVGTTEERRWAEAYIYALQRTRTAVWLWIRRRMAQDRPEVLAWGSSSRVPVELFRRRSRAEDGNYGERARGRPPAAGRLYWPRADVADGLHDAESEDSAAVMGSARRADRVSAHHPAGLAHGRSDAEPPHGMTGRCVDGEGTPRAGDENRAERIVASGARIVRGCANVADRIRRSSPSGAHRHG
jgi:hypothetical protein